MADNDDKNLEEILALTPCLGVQQVYKDYQFLMRQETNSAIMSHQQAVELLTLTYGPFSEFGAFEFEDDEEGEDEEEVPPGKLDGIWGQ